MEPNEITGEIIRCAHTVANILGAGFLEKVYEKALAHELRKAGLPVERQQPVCVTYDGIAVGNYFADLLVMGTVVVEVKATKKITEIDMAQSLNYLRATGLKICLVINFGTSRIEVKRLVHHF